MTDQTPSKNCPDCGNPLPGDSTHELCPSCLFRQALESRTVADPGSPPVPATPPPTPEEMADKFPGFEIVECLGRGGMGVVYKAHQLSLDRTVAIKILAPERVGDEKFATRFTTEAHTLAKLSHPNIVTVFDHGETGGLYYIVMEFVDGVNLRDLLREGKLDPKQALAIVPPVCEALQFAHDKGIVHRDIKPENLLLDKDGRIKIADFGIASLVGTTGDPAGTPPYMAPEQGGTSLEVDHRADIYALGAVLYETLTGERPGDTLNPPSQKVEVDVRIDDIVLRALNKEPSRRYRTADEFRTMVQTVSGTAPSPPPSENATTQPASTPATPHPPTGLADPKWTAIAAWSLIVIGAINVLAPFATIALFLLWRGGISFAGELAEPLAQRFSASSFLVGGAELLVILAALGVSLAIGAVTLIGGRHMLNGTSRNWAIAGGVAACFSPVLWVLGVVAGIGSIILAVSNKTDGSETPRTAATPAATPTSDGPRFSKLAIVSASLQGLVALLMLIIAITVGSSGGGMNPSVLAVGLPLILFSLPATILAWIAAGQIRRSEGQLLGRRLAVLCGMFLPCLLIIPFLGVGAGIVDAVITGHPRADDTTNIIFGTVTMLTFAAIALLAIRTCFRHLRGVPKNVASNPVRITATALLIFWIAIAGLLWVQRPKNVGNAITTQSPDRPFTITASTRHRMHVFGPDLLTYHFEIIGLNGTVRTSKEILVPLDRLANHPESYSPEDYYFKSTDAIQWAKEGDDITATIKIQDVTIHKITIPKNGRPHFKTSD